MAHRPYQRDGRDTEAPSDVDRLLSRLARFDDDIAHLIMQRARLMADLRRSLPKKSLKKSHPEMEVEKKLWRAFEQLAPRGVKDLSSWRTLFTLIHSMEPGGRPSEDGEDDAFLLSPKRVPLKLQIKPPTSMVQARAWTTIAGLCPAESSLYPVVLNDPLIQLVKGLNQAGAHMSWEEHSIVSRGTESISFGEKVVHCGEHAFTFYALLFVSVAMPCSLKFTGGSRLKLANFRPVERIMSQLGARLVFMAPRSTGLPVRIEASAMLSRDVMLPEDFPGEALQALCLVAHRFEEAITIRWPESQEQRIQAQLSAIAPMLSAWSLDVTIEPGSVTCRPCTPTAPESCWLPADSMLSAVMLALPLFTEMASYNSGESRTTLRNLPAESDGWKQWAVLLEQCGIALDHDGKQISSHATTADIAQDSLFLRADFNRRAPALALALSLALFTRDLGKRSLKSIRISLPREYAHTDATRDLALRFGVDSDVQRETGGHDELMLFPTHKGFDPEADLPWTSPAPEFSLALALLSYLRTGLRLTNPGNLTEMLPAFWLLYNTLPGPQEDFLFRKTSPKENEHDTPQRTRRRIRT